MLIEDSRRRLLGEEEVMVINAVSLLPLQSVGRIFGTSSVEFVSKRGRLFTF
jgi:hypothetical protein